MKPLAPRSWSIPILTAILLASLVPAGCGDMPPPAHHSEIMPRIGSGGFDPEELLRLIQMSFNATDRGGYERCLADTFAFVPYAAVPMEYPRRDMENWDRDRELDFIRQLFTVGRNVTIKLPVRIRNRGIPSNNQAVWEVDYEMRVEDTHYAGGAILGMVRIDKNWYLESWEDVTEAQVEGRTTETSGALRAQYTR